MTTLDTIKQGIERPDMSTKFASIYQSVNKCSIEQATQMAEAERFNYMSLLQDIGDVTPISAMKVFLEVISMGLTFNQAQKQVYLIARNAKNGDNWEKRLNYVISVDGMIHLAEKAGSIKYVSKPIIVYEGEEFTMQIVNGETVINHSPKLSHSPNDKMIGGYCKVVMANGDIDWTVLTLEDITRLAGYSAKQNKGTPNALYTSNNGQIDKGFFQTKIIKTALKNIRKISGATSNTHEVDEDLAIEETTELIF